MRPTRDSVGFLEEAKRKNTKVDIIGNYIDSRTKIKVKCRTCGKTWDMSPDKILYNTGCSNCHHASRIKSNEVFLSQLSCINKNIEPLERYVKDNIKIRCRCKQCGHEWYIKPNHLLNGRGCPHCKAITNGNRCRKTQKEFLSEVNDIRSDLIVLGEYKTALDKILCKCKICGFEWNPVASSIMNYATRCPLCFASKGERKIGHWLQTNNFKFEMHKTFEDLLSKSGKHLNYDFLIIDKNFLVEYQGEYHTKQHDKTDESYERQVSNDNIKRKYALDHGYKLLEIWYWDFDNIVEILEKHLNEKEKNII